MYGWRARIGHICPSIPLDNIIYEFDQMLPEGVIVSYTSLHVQYLVPEDFERALALLEGAARIMAEGEADCIVAGGDPLVALKGGDQEILDCIRRVTPVPAVSSLGAAVRALEKLGLGRVALASPYDEERNRLLAQFLAGQGIEVVASKGLGLRRAMDMGKLPFHASYQLAREALREAPQADGIYIPCARFPVVGNIEALEADLERPVVTSVQAMVWWALDTLDIRTPVPGYGQLMETL